MKAIQFEGIEAPSKNIATGRYELSRPFLVLYSSGELKKDSQDFIQYLKSKEAKALIDEYGYTPIK